MSFFGSLLSGLGSIATGLLGSKASPAANPAAGGAFMMPSQVPVAPQAQNPRPLSGQFLDGLKEVMPNAGSALASYATAGLQGKAVKKFNDSAYPGTTPWEQLGSGADGGSMVDMGTKADEMRQREKESQRVQETAFAQSRMQAALLVAGELLKNGGNASLAGAERVLMSSGVLSPAGFGVDPRTFSADRVRADIGNLQASARRQHADASWSEQLLPHERALKHSQSAAADASKDCDYAQADLLRTEEWLRPYETAIRAWSSVVGVNVGDVLEVFRGVRSRRGGKSSDPGKDSSYQNEVAFELLKKSREDGWDVGEGDLFDLFERFHE